MADAAAQLGGIDVLVNNAGIGGPTAPVQDVDADDWEQVLKVDLTKHAIPHLIRSGNGSIIVMSSAAGRFGYPNRSPYSTVKMGTDRIHEDARDGAWRAQYSRQRHSSGGRGRRPDPARVRSPAKATGKSIGEIREIAMANQSIKKLIDPKDIAELAVFLASDATKTISGQSLPIDADMQRN